MGARRLGRGGDESGAILVLVLLLILAIALIIGALLSATSTAQIVTQAQTAFHTDAYGVDQGIEYGLQKLQTDSTWCADSSTTGTVTDTVTDPNVPGGTVPVTVGCHTTYGSSTSVSNWAVYTVDPGANSLTSQSGGGVTKQILGPTYVGGGIYFQSPVESDLTTAGDKNGYLLQHALACPGGLGYPNNFTGHWSCTTTAPTVTATLPGSVPGPPRAASVSGRCTILYPGRYTTAPVLTAQTYLASGVYYLDNIGTLDLGSNSLFGGMPNTASGEKQVVTTSSPCATDASAGAAGNGTGVEIILGGDSAINVDKGDIELYARQAATVGSEGSAGVSLRTVPAGAAGWDASSVGSGSDIFYVSSGNNAHAAVHGFIYAPNASVALFATNTSQAEVLGGVLAWDVSLQASASASGLVVQTATSPTVRTTNVTASVRYRSKTVTATAAVEVQNDAARTVTIDSWVVNNP